MAKHTHKFIRVSMKGLDSKIWKCAFADCTWFVHMGLAHLIPGKSSRCWECDEQFIMDEDAMKDDMPKCEEHRELHIAPPTITDTPPAPTRTPEQQAAYEKIMASQFGKNWKKLLEG